MKNCYCNFFHCKRVYGNTLQ